MIPDFLAPDPKPTKVVKPGEFQFAVAALAHDHIYGMCEALIEAGATLTHLFDTDETKIAKFLKRFPDVQVVEHLETLLENDALQLIAAAAIPNERAALGIRVMQASKDYFTDKTPFTTLEQLRELKKVTAQTSRKYMVYYSERLHVESAMYAGQLIERGVIGRVVQVMGLGPHRIRAHKRPDWFFVKEQYGGILCDIGSHQMEQFLTYSGAKDAQVLNARVDNFNHHQYPELEDFGEASFQGDNGASSYFRVDWFTPDGLSNWGDGRMFILGTEGYIELRKYMDVGRDTTPDNVYLVNGEREYHLQVAGKVGYAFFHQLIHDCLHRTETAMTQEHIFKATELAIKAQLMADARAPLRNNTTS